MDQHVDGCSMITTEIILLPLASSCVSTHQASCGLPPSPLSACVALVFRNIPCLTRLSPFIIYHIVSGLNVRRSHLTERCWRNSTLCFKGTLLSIFLFPIIFLRCSVCQETSFDLRPTFELRISLLAMNGYSGLVERHPCWNGSLAVLRLVHFLMSHMSFGQLMINVLPNT